MNRLAMASIATVAGAVAMGGGWRLGRTHSAVAVAPAPAFNQTVASPARATPYEAAAAPDYDARRDRSLHDILSAIDAVRFDPVTLATFDNRVSGELFAVLASRTAEEIPMVLEHLSALPPPNPDRILAAVLGRWARQDGAAAMTWARRVSPENRAETVANTLAQAQIDGQNPDIAKFAGDAGLTAEALATKVESARQILNSRR